MGAGCTVIDGTDCRRRRQWIDGELSWPDLGWSSFAYTQGRPTAPVPAEAPSLGGTIEGQTTGQRFDTVHNRLLTLLFGYWPSRRASAAEQRRRGSTSR